MWVCAYPHAQSRASIGLGQIYQGGDGAGGRGKGRGKGKPSGNNSRTEME